MHLIVCGHTGIQNNKRLVVIQFLELHLMLPKHLSMLAQAPLCEFPTERLDPSYYGEKIHQKVSPNLENCIGSMLQMERESALGVVERE